MMTPWYSDFQGLIDGIQMHFRAINHPFEN
jgi:hypothetical protein